MERKPFPSETQERFIVRLPDGMRDRISEAAKANNRSMNAEIVARLSESFAPPALGFGKGSRVEGFEQARQDVLAKMEASVPEIADRVWQLVAERMKNEKK